MEAEGPEGLGQDSSADDARALRAKVEIRVREDGARDLSSNLRADESSGWVWESAHALEATLVRLGGGCDWERCRVLEATPLTYRTRGGHRGATAAPAAAHSRRLLNHAPNLTLTLTLTLTRLLSHAAHRRSTSPTLHLTHAPHSRTSPTHLAHAPHPRGS